MPVFEGWEEIEETLASIQEQSFSDFRLLISIDGDDERSYRLCQQYLRDSRIDLVLQRDRLGWAGNINWLMRQLREPFFCYWQHDDPCDPAYLGELVKKANSHPEAACVYSDMRFIGEKIGDFHYEPIMGFSLQRVLQQIEQNLAVPLRGLIRRAAIERAGPIGTAYDGAKQETAWIAKLAREGDLVCVPKPLYFKRRRVGSSSWTWKEWSPERWRAVTLEWALEVLDAALPAAHSSDHDRVLAAIVDRMVVRRPGRHFYYELPTDDPDDAVGLVAEFLHAAHQRFGVFPRVIPRDNDLGPASAGEQLSHPSVEAARLIERALPRSGVGGESYQAEAVHASQKGGNQSIEVLGSEAGPPPCRLQK